MATWRSTQPNFVRSSPTPWPIFKAGGSAEAERAYRAALAIVPADPAVTHNLGVAIAAQGRHRDAIGCFDEALAADPGFVSAHYNRAVALMALGETQEAIKAFSRAATLEPQHYEAHRALGFLWLSQGERGRALDHFARTYELRRGDDRTTIALKSLTTTTRHKLEHDAEQFLYLSQRTRDGLRFELLARNYRAIAKQVPDEVDHAVRCADRRAGRGLQHADPSARSARGRGPRRQ